MAHRRATTAPAQASVSPLLLLLMLLILPAYLTRAPAAAPGAEGPSPPSPPSPAGGECAAEWAEDEEEWAGPEEGPAWRGAWAPLLEDLATDPASRARADDQPQSPRQVSETDIYLLDAIEKLTYRIDFLDKRLRRVEAMLYHLTTAQDSAPQGTSTSSSEAAAATATAKPEAPSSAGVPGAGAGAEEACGGGAGGEWRRVGRLPSCYRFARDAVDWKAAAAACRAQGAALLELEDARETKALLAHLRATQHLRGTAFWTGGLNPGLLWLWAGSGRPVAANASAAAALGVGAQDGVRGAGRCLQLAPAPGVGFEYRGVDCGKRARFVCERPDNAAARGLARLARARRLRHPCP